MLTRVSEHSPTKDPRGEPTAASRAELPPQPGASGKPRLSLLDIVDFRRPAFRLAALFATAFAATTLLLFAFIFWQTAIVENKRVDHILERDAELSSRESPEEILRLVKTRVAADLHRVAYAALFDADGRPIAGNLERLPSDVPPDAHAHQTEWPAPGADSPRLESVRMVAHRLPDGRLLVIGRSIDSLQELRGVVIRALELGVIPAVAMALLVGAFASRRAQRQVKAVHETAERIMRGDLRERLPTRGNGDDFDRLVGSVNHMLDEIERLLSDAKNTSYNIAHDLRAPLTRVRRQLERARETARSREELQRMVDRSIGGLDHALAIITALLRIAQIDRRHRRAGFHPVDLHTVVQEVGEFFSAVAEDKGIDFRLEVADMPAIQGDADLLREALTNLVDNAVKFTPSGGTVRLGVRLAHGHPVISVADTGPGIRPEEREAVFQRFYRCHKGSEVPGYGLGLSLVDAIVRLHGFQFVFRDETLGCTIQLHCWPETP